MLALLCIIAFSMSTICVPTICKPKIANSSLCYNVSAVEKTYFITANDLFLQCEANLYCKQDIGKCTQLGKSGDWCVSYRDCVGHYCINHVCQDRQSKKGEACDGDIPQYENQCEKGLVCDSTKCVVPIKIGNTGCMKDGYDLCNPLEAMCFNGVCTKWYSKDNGANAKYIAKLCSSYAVDDSGNCISRALLPKLLGEYPIKCKSQFDCKYSKPIGTNDVCECPKDNKNGDSYCVYGGGEEEIRLAVDALKQYSNSADKNHDPVYIRLEKMSSERERLELIDPAECSYSNMVKNAHANYQPIFIVVVIVVAIALIPLLLVLLAVIFCNK